MDRYILTLALLFASSMTFARCRSSSLNSTPTRRCQNPHPEKSIKQLAMVNSH